MWTAGELTDGQAVLVVDETGDEKSSTDCVGAARQSSGALGGIGVCPVAVHLTYVTARGHAPIDRALYLGADWAADEERRLLTGVPDDIEFATKPQLAAAMLQRVRDLGIPARWLAGDEVYGGRELRRTARTLGFDYVLAVRADHRVDTAVGRLTVTELAARVPKRNWMRMRTGHGLKGDPTTTGPCSTSTATTPPTARMPGTPSCWSAATATPANYPFIRTGWS